MTDLLSLYLGHLAARKCVRIPPFNPPTGPPKKHPENPQKLSSPPLLLWRLGLVFSRVQARSIASRRTASKPAVRRGGVHGGSSSSPWRVGVVELGGERRLTKTLAEPNDGWGAIWRVPRFFRVRPFWARLSDLFQVVKHFSIWVIKRSVGRSWWKSFAYLHDFIIL